ncbi:MAG: LUD domain-containing protein [Acidobacteria bacterium]|nr:LUD domain-containing protein [Acidobacteriota bacterium]
MDRDVFLARVGRSAMTAVLPEVLGIPDRLPDLEDEDLQTLFRERAQDVDAVVHGPVGRHGVPRAVAGIAAGHQCRSFMAWDDLPASGVASALTAAGLTRVEGEVPVETRMEHQLGYRDLDLGVTGATAGLAESGSVVLEHRPGRPRMASLVPEVHVALLDLILMERTLVHWAHKFPESVADTANLVVITGPSRTGDIEQQLTLGVHGPKHVHIVLIK